MAQFEPFLAPIRKAGMPIHLDGTVRRVSLFRIDTPTPISLALCQLIVTTTGELVEAVSHLRQQKGVCGAERGGFGLKSGCRHTAITAKPHLFAYRG